jgi:heterodisulfide reductase subunit C2
MVKSNLNFKRAVLEMVLGGEKLKTCFQCGKCNDVCPVSQRWGSRYNPRDLVLFSSLGYQEALVQAVQRDPFLLWGCTACETCDEKCPAEIPITDIITVLKNAVVPLGLTPKFYPEAEKVIMDNGVAVPSMSAIEKRRTKMGLPTTPPDPSKEEVQTIMKKLGIPEILEKAGGGLKE